MTGTADVVVGAGLGGMSAAITAATRGAAEKGVVRRWRGRILRRAGVGGLGLPAGSLGAAADRFNAHADAGEDPVLAANETADRP